MTRHHNRGAPGARQRYDGPLCRLSELPVAWCALCSGICDPSGPRQDRLRGPALTETDVHTADHAGRVCAWCGNSFRDGSAIGVSWDDDYVCEDCTP